MHPQRYLDTRGAAAYTGLGFSTLEKKRIFGGDAPPFLKVGRRILYDVDALDAWMAVHQRASTSDV